MGVKWWSSSCFVRCCFLDLFNIPRSILMQLPSKFFSIRLVSVQIVHPYTSMNTTADWKKLCFILLDWSDFNITESLLMPFARGVLMSFSVYNCCQFIFTKGTDTYNIFRSTGGCPRGLMVKAMNCRILVRQFVLTSNYYFGKIPLGMV